MPTEDKRRLAYHSTDDHPPRTALGVSQAKPEEKYTDSKGDARAHPDGGPTSRAAEELFRTSS
jgi:hypothetical protein